MTNWAFSYCKDVKVASVKKKMDCSKALRNRFLSVTHFYIIMFS